LWIDRITASKNCEDGDGGSSVFLAINFLKKQEKSVILNKGTASCEVNRAQRKSAATESTFHSLPGSNGE
jgi:hypothetical protein